MKKSSLATAVVAGLTGIAGLTSVALAQSAPAALYLNPDGLGQVLIYPYYTTNGGNATLMSVVNTTDRTKAVKVRFLEGRNSQEVLDFNLYLSPFDVWTGSISDDGDATGPGILSTSDNSCTAPDIIGRPGSSVAFRNFQYAAFNQDDGPQGLERTREGYFEMIEMGDVVNNGSALDLVVEVAGSGAALGRNFASDAIHDAAGVPANCADIRNSWADGGVWATNAHIDMLPPSGGLFGAASVVDLANGTNLSYNADAVEGFYQNQGVFASGLARTLHTGPGSLAPDLGNAATVLGGAANAVVFNNGTAVTLEFDSGEGLRAVSAVFMYDNLFNEFSSDAALGASSEWVITFPTKRFHLENGGPYEAGDPSSIRAMRPFTDLNDSTGDGLVFDTNGSCEIIGILFRDREEGPAEGPAGPIEFSPPPPGQQSGPLSLCYEAQVVSFNQDNVGEGANPSEVLGSSYARNIPLSGTAGPLTDGWVRMKLGVDVRNAGAATSLGNTVGNFLLDDSSTINGTTTDGRLFGLPATGFYALKVVREVGGDANFSGLWRHRGNRRGDSVTETVANVGFVPGCTTFNPGTGLFDPCPNFTTTTPTFGSAGTFVLS